MDKVMELTGRLYRLRSHVRHYAWGMRRHGETAPFIADLLGEEPGKSIPWAELWIGAHPSLSSDIILDGGAERLDKAIEYSDGGCLGDLPAGAKARALPFLLKVLSCERALSIQSHPDRGMAKVLHEQDPQNYPDDNHKPEVMIAVTPFEAMAGFKELGPVLDDLNRLASIAPWRMIWEEACHLSMSTLCVTLLNLPASIARSMLVGLYHELKEAGRALSDSDRLCLSLMEQYPCDRGAMFAYLLNHVTLEPGQALFIPANEPHAYLFGTGIECMANSDNVIRAGLTGKFVDIRRLLATLNFSPFAVERNGGERLASGERVYTVPASEFAVSFFEGGAAMDIGGRRPVAGVLLVLDGRCEFDDGTGKTVVMERGSTWFRPASLRTGMVRPLDNSSRFVLAEVGK